jgi:hypothetical protein
MSLENVPRCQHVKVNGTQCGSPALRRRRRCYFHDRMRNGKRRFAAESGIKPRPLFSIGLLEDANSVQVALMQVLQLLGGGQMDPKTAGLMLYGLQTASANLKNTTFEAEKATDVVIDRGTVDQTCINGPQWFARDFAEEVLADEVEEDEESVAVAAGGEQVSKSAGNSCRPGKLRAGKLRTDKRKRPEAAGVEEAPTWAQNILRRIEAARDGVEPNLIRSTG